MTRLRTAKLAGVKGERRKVSLAMDYGPLKTVTAVRYGQWAIHRHLFLQGFTVTHIPTGYSTENGPIALEASARQLVKGLLAVRDFKTPRAKATREHCCEVYREWKRDLT